MMNNKTNNKKKSKEMINEDYGKTIISALLIVILLVGGFFGYKKLDKETNKEKNKIVLTVDEKKFKKEYESLNGKKRSNGHVNKKINIIEDNNIEYISTSKVVDVIKNGTGIVYFGFSACPWCRNAVPQLLSAMSNSNLEKIYYVDVRADDLNENDIRDLWELNEKNKAIKTKEPAEGYYDLLNVLDSQLEEYKLTTNKGKEVSTNEKRLYAPTVVAVKDGQVVGFHSGTVDNHVKDENGELRDLTKEEREELVNIYSKMISNVLESDCNDHSGC